MNFLVTGGSGYIGSVFVEVATAAGHRCLVIDRLPALTSLPSTAAQHQQFYLGTDPLTAELVARVKEFQPHAVHHFAAISAVVGVAATAYQENITSTEALLTILATAAPNATLIFASTCAVFGNAASVSDINSPHAPVSEYGRSKSQCEELLQASSQPLVIMRYTNVGGATVQHGEQRQHETHLIPNLIDAALHDQPVTVFGQGLATRDGTYERDYVHVLDIVNAHLLASANCADRQGKQHTFHLGNGTPHSNLEVVRSVERVCATTLKVRRAPSRPGDALAVSLDHHHAHTMLGFHPQYPQLDAIVHSTYLYRRCRN
ncbi:MAG: NAD-dependent epimerase/dehydratase family protein [Pseudomonadota bacterium]|nr:NAD-dependent epimerase/dehydratase family protein [Pseudomonadota bacterium]